MAIVVPQAEARHLPLHQIFNCFPVGPTGDRQLAFLPRVYAGIPAFPAEPAQANVLRP